MTNSISFGEILSKNNTLSFFLLQRKRQKQKERKKEIEKSEATVYFVCARIRIKERRITLSCNNNNYVMFLTANMS